MRGIRKALSAEKDGDTSWILGKKRKEIRVYESNNKVFLEATIQNALCKCSPFSTILGQVNWIPDIHDNISQHLLIWLILNF